MKRQLSRRRARSRKMLAAGDLSPFVVFSRNGSFKRDKIRWAFSAELVEVEI